MAPRADQSRQARHGAHGVAAGGVALDGDAHADDRRLRDGEFAGEGPDVVGAEAGDIGYPARREAGRAGFQVLVADGVFFDIVVVDEILGDDDVDHAERQGGVGAGLDGEVPVGLFGRPGGDRIDDYDLGAAALRLGDERPVVQVGADRVDRPQDDVAGMDEALRVDRRGRAAGHEEGGDGGGIAEGPLGHGRAELVEEGVAGVQPVQDALGAEIAVGQDGGGPVALDDFGPAARNLLEGLVPADRLKLSGALRAGPAQRGEHPVLAVDPVLVVVDLDAQAALCERMVRVAAHVDDFAVADRGQHRAGVGAIVRTGAEYRSFDHRFSPYPDAKSIFGEEGYRAFARNCITGPCYPVTFFCSCRGIAQHFC